MSKAQFAPIFGMEISIAWKRGRTRPRAVFRTYLPSRARLLDMAPFARRIHSGPWRDDLCGVDGIPPGPCAGTPRRLRAASFRAPKRNGSTVLLGGADGGLDDREDVLEIVHHVAIPKADDAVSLGLQEPGARIIILNLLQMLRAVQFDDEFLFDADEIRDVISNRVLTPKVDSLLVIAQDRP